MSNERCDAEVGSIKNGWHVCGRKAKVKATQHRGGVPDSYYYTMAYCSRHRHQIHDLPDGITQGEITEV